MDFNSYVDLAERAANGEALSSDSVRKIISARGLHDETVLHFAAVEGCVEVVKWLWRHGADVNCKNKFDRTPLMDAAQLADLDMVECLIQCKADVSLADRNGNTALHFSFMSSKRNQRLIEVLVEAGASMFIRNKYGEMPQDC